MSLTHGWFPTTVQAIAALVLLVAVGWRSKRWRFVWLPCALAGGAALVVATRWYLNNEGIAGDDPAPHDFWIWIALCGAAVIVVVAGWASAPWWRRGLSVAAVPLCVLCIALALNLWVGYFPTATSMWEQVTAGPLPGQVDARTVTTMRQQRRIPDKGTVVPVQIDSTASGFRHRVEYVYLPPAWFATNPPPRLPTIMMIGGQFNTPGDWVRTGSAVNTVDQFASTHHGNAPVLVFVDAAGTFNNDTECVNGPRGRSADHLTKDVAPYMVANFGVSPAASHWGIAGWSMGGTCAVDLAVSHPDMFSTFVDIAGDIGPNAGSKSQTIARLFGGNAAAWAEFDPITVMARHGRYNGLAGWFAVNSASARDQLHAANSLCATGSAKGIHCAVVTQTGKHDWPFASRAFAAALPWLAGRVGTPQAPVVPLPRQLPSASYIQTAAK